MVDHANSGGDSPSTPSSADRLLHKLTEDWTETQRILGRQETALGNLAESQRDTNQALKELAKTLDTKTSTDIYKILGAILAFAAILLTYVQMGRVSTAEKFKSIGNALERIDDRAIAHISMEGHPTGMAIIKAESKRLDELVQQTSREMSVVEDRFDERMAKFWEALVSIRTTRFTADHGAALRAELMDEVRRLNDMIDRIREDRFTDDDGHRHAQRIKDLEEGVARVQALLKDTREEQKRP